MPKASERRRGSSPAPPRNVSRLLPIPFCVQDSESVRGQCKCNLKLLAFSFWDLISILFAREPKKLSIRSSFLFIS
ncbi:hypothetical protein MLD38_006079 [Melastoma candidum]|uniref:Uncharacterized protein n=1 Tax=Melastoma candidum TaxID=119954 RepID=A0ACB9RQH9_9MYRT|nr:hypothetical protein MLD38_006079 [Melastoma candidum]